MPTENHGTTKKDAANDQYAGQSGFAVVVETIVGVVRFNKGSDDDYITAAFRLIGEHYANDNDHEPRVYRFPGPGLGENIEIVVTSRRGQDFQSVDPASSRLAG